jgi:PAS domain S-box-containing protein
MMRGIGKSITFKWMIFSILLATIPLAIAGLTIIQIYQKNLKESIIEVEKEKINSIVEINRILFAMVVNNLLSLSEEKEFEMNNPSRVKRHLEKLLHHHYYFIELTSLDERGREVVRVSKEIQSGWSGPKDHSESEMFEVASRGQTFYKDFFSPEDIYPTVIVAVPVGKYLGKPTGVVSAKIYLRDLWNWVPQTLYGGRSSVHILSQSGFMIDYPHTIRMELDPFLGGVTAGGKGVSELENLRGEKYLFVYKPVKELNWSIIARVPLEEAFTPIRQIAFAALRSILIVLGIAVLVSFLLARKLTRPIKHLSGEMARVSQGNLDVYVESAMEDEVGALTESFNRMVRDLKRSQQVLKEAEEKYRMIFENSKDMVFITSLDGRFIEINQAGAEMLGYSNREEMKEIRVKDTYAHLEERKKFRDNVAENGFVKDFEVKLKRKDGIPLDCLITATARKNKEGLIIGYEGTIKNISYRKRMEEALYQRTKELETLYDLSSLINQSLNLDKVLPMALERVLTLTGFEMGTIYLVSDDGEWLELRYHKNYPSHLAEAVKRIKWGEGVSGSTVERKDIIIFPIDEYPSPHILQNLIEEKVRTLVGIPLFSKGKAIGAICLTSRSDRFLGQNEIHLFESLGNQIGMAIENAKLFSSVEKAKSEWETTFDAVTDLITIRDRDYRILRANQSAFRRWGMGPEKMIGKRCYEILHHLSSPCQECYVTEALKTGRPTSGERESQHLNGIFQYYTYPVYDDSGEIIAMVDLAREITEKKRLETEKEIVNNINKIIASSLDVRDVFKAVHSELNKIFRSERMTVVLLNEDYQGLQFFVLDKDCETKELMEGVTYPLKGTPSAEVAQTGLPVIISNLEESDYWSSKTLLKEGIRSILVFPLKYKGKIIGTVNLGSFETDHFSEKQFNVLQQVAPGLAISIQNAHLLDEIRGSEEKYRTVVEGALDGVLIVGDDYMFEFVNGRLAEMLGYTREELIGMNFRELLDEESKTLVTNRYIRRQRGENVPPQYEFNVVRKDGEVRNVEISSSVIKDAAGITHTIAFLKDITEKKKMEEQLLQSEKLRAMGEMASGVAHDFNNALAAILGNTQLLLYSVQEEEVRESLKTIEKVAKDSAQVVKRLQDFTRKRAHQELFQVDVNTVIKDVIEMTKPKWKDDAQGRGGEIEVVSNFEQVPAVGGNGFELREVITNLIFNAIEAMPQGGRIDIRTFQKNGRVHLRVADTGVGMAEEVRKKIFEPFFTTKPFTNTGLGLSMSYGIIERFGGEIEVESKIGSGTAFTIILPIAVEGKEEVIFDPVIKKGRQARILLIDDEETVRDVLAKMLSQVNHQVTVAKSGEEGVRIFGDLEFDMVLTDLGMPGMSGWEVCQKIKKMNPYMPVGMITGWGMEVSQSKMEECGLDFIINKPFDFNQIVTVVSEKIESRTSFLS